MGAKYLGEGGNPEIYFNYVKFEISDLFKQAHQVDIL